MIDLVVAGGGPVGLATALYAARAGLHVVVHEPRTGTIDKACGEGLMPGAVAALAALGVDPAGRSLAGISYRCDQAFAQAGFRGGAGRGVRRTVLHAALRSAVADAGVEVVTASVVRVVQHPESVVVDGTSARYLVAADGLHSPTRRRLGLDLPAAPLRRHGLRVHATISPWTDHVEVHWAPDAEAYVTPVADDLVGVALLSTRRCSFPVQLTSFPDLRDRLAGAELSTVRGAGPLRQRSARRVAGRVLLAGDASGYVDALTGEGIALGMAQAAAAVDAVVADDPLSYELAWRQITRRYRWLTIALVQGTRLPLLRRRLVPTAAAMPGAFSAAVNQLARPVRPPRCSPPCPRSRW